MSEEFFCFSTRIFAEKRKNPRFCFVRMIKSRTFAPLLEKQLEIKQFVTPAVVY